MTRLGDQVLTPLNVKSFTLGFTGTRKGMTDAQKERFVKYLRELAPTYFRFGMAVGADYEAFLLVRSHAPRVQIIGHPSNIASQRQLCSVDVLLDESEPLLRNRVIVMQSDVLAVAPAEKHEMLRGGTWSTYRFAQKQGKQILLIKP